MTDREVTVQYEVVIEIDGVKDWVKNEPLMRDVLVTGLQEKLRELFKNPSRLYVELVEAE